MKVKDLRAILQQANGEMEVYILDNIGNEHEIFSISGRTRATGDQPYLCIWQIYGVAHPQTGQEVINFWQHGQHTPAPLPEPPLPPHAKIMTHIPDDAIPNKDPFA